MHQFTTPLLKIAEEDLMRRAPWRSTLLSILGKAPQSFSPDVYESLIVYEIVKFIELVITHKRMAHRLCVMMLNKYLPVIIIHMLWVMMSGMELRRDEEYSKYNHLESGAYKTNNKLVENYVRKQKNS